MNDNLIYNNGKFLLNGKEIATSEIVLQILAEILQGGIDSLSVAELLNNAATIKSIDNDEYVFLLLDNDDKILFGIKKDGVYVSAQLDAIKELIPNSSTFATADELNDAKSRIDALENVNVRNVIVCDGDSLTWGDYGVGYEVDGHRRSPYNFPAILQQKLGSRFKVVNYGIPGVASTTIVGNAIGYKIDSIENDTFAMGNVSSNGTRNSSKMSISFLLPKSKEIGGNSYDIQTFSFGPIQSQADGESIRGGCYPVYLNGVRGDMIKADSNADTWRFRSWDELPEGFTAKVGDVIWTNEAVSCNGASRVIFMGANGGWKFSNDTSVQNADNIAEWLEQVDSIISVSNDLYTVISYCQWFVSNGNNEPVTPWTGESVCQTKYGKHYINLRAYVSSAQCVYDAIDRGYMTLSDYRSNYQSVDGKVYNDNDEKDTSGLDATSRIARGIPCRFLRSGDGVHFNDVGYHLIGDLVHDKFMELWKAKVKGE